MSTNTTYNGWTNYATWRVNLEICDGLDLRDTYRDKPETREVADYLEEYVNEILDQSGDGLALDYARSFVSDVDFHEIAEHLIEAAEYEEEEELEND
jgi:hypothetical protein